MSRALVFFAGKSAMQAIRKDGLHPSMVGAMAGAAGGPKWLVLYGLDRFLFGQWFSGRSEPLPLVGSSIGSWRFTAASTADPVSALDRFREAYLEQSYSANPSPQEVTRESLRIFSRFVNDEDISAILSNPVFRLNCLAVRCRFLPLQSDNKPVQVAGLGLSAFFNMFSRASLAVFFQRTLFYHPAGRPWPVSINGFGYRPVSLDRDNLRQAVLASGSIPVVMSGVRDIPGAPPGVYRDGGLMDYHVNLPFSVDDGKIVLFPHYIDRVIPGWFDKKLPWRKPVAKWLDNVLMVAPSPEFVESLPFSRIPERGDFAFFQGRDSDRIRFWDDVAKRSLELACEFESVTTSGKIAELVTQFP